MTKINFEVKDFSVIEEDTDSQFATAQILAFSSGWNRHDMTCTPETLRKTAPTIYEKPIIFEVNRNLQDFGSHNAGVTVPAGFILPDSAEFTEDEDKRLNLKVIAKIWKMYSGQFIDMFKLNNRTSSKVSVEMEVLDMEERPDGLTELKDFIYSSVCVLGDMITEASPGANIQMLSFADMKNEYNKEFSKEPTHFPRQGMSKKVHLDNSDYPQFDFDYAIDVKDKYPKLWSKSGNIRGNTSFDMWSKARSGKNGKDVSEWIVEREKWATRHKYDKTINGAVSAMKWGVVLNGGLDFMKDIVDKEKKPYTSYFEDTKEKEEEIEKMEVGVNMDKDKEKEAEEEKKEQETPEEEKSETPADEKKEEKSEDKKEEFSLQAYVDVGATLAMLEAETEQNEEAVMMACDELKKGENFEVGVVMKGMYAKMCKMSETIKSCRESMAAFEEKERAYMGQVGELSKFKADMEANQFNYEVGVTMKEIENACSMPKEEFEALKEKAKEFSIETIETWKNLAKAKAFTFASKPNKSVNSDLPKYGIIWNVGSDTKKVNDSPWK